ncbi:MAG: T9SS type A sorting domain-containing protein [Bacteroidota bacterium]
MFWTEGFENADPSSGTRSAINHTDTKNGTGPGVCGPGNYFFRINTANDAPTGVSIAFSGFTGFYWRGEDLNACVANPDVIEFNGIDISGLAGFRLSGLFGCNGAIVWEISDGDGIFIEHRVDGGPYQQNITLLSTASKNLQQDTDFDGVPDGIILGPNFQELSHEFSVTGSTLDLRITIFADDGSEEFGFDELVLEHSVSLPVHLSKFEGSYIDGQVQLIWETQNETNNEGFEVQRLDTDSRWETLAFIDGNGNSNRVQQYDYIDKRPLNEKSYYRLRQVDFDTNFSHSDIISVDTQLKGSDVRLSRFFVQEEVEFETMYKGMVKLFTTSGQLVQMSEMEGSSIDVSQLNSGMYFIMFTGSEIHKTFRFYKI